jgi:hypothetical protein
MNAKKSKKKKIRSHYCVMLLFLSTTLSWTVLSSPVLAQEKLKRFHLKIEGGYFLADGVGGNFKELLTNWGFNYSWAGGAGILEGPGATYPSGTQGNYFVVLRVDYSLSPRWALSLKAAPMAEWDIDGLKQFHEGPYSDTDYLDLNCRFKGGSYYAGFVYTTPMTKEKGSSPIFQGANYVWNFGAGIGLEVIRLDYEMSENRALSWFGIKSTANFSKKGLGSYVFGELEYFLSQDISLGGHVSYKYVFPVKFESFNMTAYNTIQDELVSFPVIFPEHKVNFSGIGIGLSIGYHF